MERWEGPILDLKFADYGRPTFINVPAGPSILNHKWGSQPGFKNDQDIMEFWTKWNVDTPKRNKNMVGIYLLVRTAGSRFHEVLQDKKDEDYTSLEGGKTALPQTSIQLGPAGAAGI